jgi:NADH-quinone oxidoreductase subunit L
MSVLREEWHGLMEFTLHGMMAPPFMLAVAGIATSAYLYLLRPDIPEAIKNRMGPIYRLLENKYYFDRFNEIVFAGGARSLGGGLWRVGDQTLIDGGMVHGSAALVARASSVIRRLQTGFLYNYAFMMIFGVFALLTIWLFKA